MITLAGIPVTEAPKFVVQNIDVVWVLFIGALAYIVWSVRKTCGYVIDKLENHETRLSTIEGAHDTYIRNGGHQ
jgi:hypothetical protein